MTQHGSLREKLKSGYNNNSVTTAFFKFAMLQKHCEA